jgi:hypothetical protein
VNAKPREEWFQALRLKLSIENARMAQVIEVRDVNICLCSLVSAVLARHRSRSLSPLRDLSALGGS